MMSTLMTCWVRNLQEWQDPLFLDWSIYSKNNTKYLLLATTRIESPWIKMENNEKKQAYEEKMRDQFRYGCKKLRCLGDCVYESGTEGGTWREWYKFRNHWLIAIIKRPEAAWDHLRSEYRQKRLKDWDLRHITLNV